MASSLGQRSSHAEVDLMFVAVVGTVGTIVRSNAVKTPPCTNFATARGNRLSTAKKTQGILLRVAHLMGYMFQKEREKRGKKKRTDAS